MKDATAEKVAIGGVVFCIACVLVPTVFENQLGDTASIDPPVATLVLWLLLSAVGGTLIVRAESESATWKHNRWVWAGMWVFGMAFTSMILSSSGNVALDRGETTYQHATFVRQYQRRTGHGGSATTFVYRLPDRTEISTSFALRSSTIELHPGAFGMRWFRVEH